MNVVQNSQWKNPDKLPVLFQSFRTYRGGNTFILRYLSRRLDIQKVSVGVAANCQFHKGWVRHFSETDELLQELILCGGV